LWPTWKTKSCAEKGGMCLTKIHSVGQIWYHYKTKLERIMALWLKHNSLYIFIGIIWQKTKQENV